ncbi:MAG: hypothetical protein QW776_00005 [Candidatus Nitrosocaldus sp.]
MNMHIDSCKHRIIYDQEWVCCKCGRVFNEEEVEELQKGSMEVTAIKSLESIGLDPHGKTPLWQYGLGSIEGYKHEKDQGSREDISIISNIADKLQLPSYAMLEFADLYRRFCKSKEDRLPATLLAICILMHKANVRDRVLSILNSSVGLEGRKLYCYIEEIIRMQFGLVAKAEYIPMIEKYIAINGKEGIELLIENASRYGASRALYAMRVYALSYRR